jgi:small subunit ribosomal protein S8
MSDPIADMLNQIKNANHKFIENIEFPASKLKVELAKVLKEEGYISNFKVAQDQRHQTLKITMKFSAQKERLIQGMRRVSRPGLRVYRPYFEIPVIKKGLGTAIVSTSRGVMSGKKAKEKKVGGEVLCYIW